MSFLEMIIIALLVIMTFSFISCRKNARMFRVSLINYVTSFEDARWDAFIFFTSSIVCCIFLSAYLLN